MKKSLDINQSSNEFHELGVSEDEIQEINFEIKDPKESGAKEENQIDDNRVNDLENNIKELKLKLQEKDNIINEDKKQINELNNTILELKDEIE